MRIYIIGPVGSGKTTLAKRLSNKYKINYYELDKVVWDDLNGNIKRSEKKINKMFFKIISKKNWIIEDVGRDIFKDGIINADKVYYLDYSRVILYKRCVSRWVRQKIGREEYNYKPTIKGLIDMIKWVNKDIKYKNSKIDYIRENTNNLEIITYNKNVI